MNFLCKVQTRNYFGFMCLLFFFLFCFCKENAIRLVYNLEYYAMKSAARYGCYDSHKPKMRYILYLGEVILEDEVSSF